MGDSETIRPGLALIVTGPFAAVSETGNDGASLLVAVLLVAVLPEAELLDAEPQPASSAAAVTAANTQTILFITVPLPPGNGKEGETVGGQLKRLPAETDHPSHEG